MLFALLSAIDLAAQDEKDRALNSLMQDDAPVEGEGGDGGSEASSVLTLLVEESDDDDDGELAKAQLARSFRTFEISDKRLRLHVHFVGSLSGSRSQSTF